jgi:two-component system NtrC family sensor kinase
MLIQEDIDPKSPVYEELGTITNEALRCRKIVSSLLDFARQTRPAKKLHNINDIIEECIRLTRKQAEFKDITIRKSLSEKVPELFLDKEQIQQALINLILNATDATDPGGQITVSTAVLPGNQFVTIDVSDTGKGIADEVIDKIFEPFFTTREIGTGLGLAITHGIVGQHGGDISVQSRPNHGTTFTIRLPINKGNQDGRA